MPLEWTESTDDGETIYEAASRSTGYAYDGGPLLWTVSREPSGKWGIDMTDFELLPEEDAGREFATLADVQAHCERREAELVARDRRLDDIAKEL